MSMHVRCSTMLLIAANIRAAMVSGSQANSVPMDVFRELLLAGSPAAGIPTSGWRTEKFWPKLVGIERVAVRAAGDLTQRRVKARSAERLMTEGLDIENDAVGPAIYGGRVKRDDFGEVIFSENKNVDKYNHARPGPAYAGGGYTQMSKAIQIGPEAVLALLRDRPEYALEITTGNATPLHMCGMSKKGQLSTRLLLDARKRLGENNVDAKDSWGLTPLQRMASNNLDEGGIELVNAGADFMTSNAGSTAKEMAMKRRAYALLKAMQLKQLEEGTLPDDELRVP